MPRIRPSVFYRARTINPALPSLLPVCRDLPSARRELRWLDEHAKEILKHVNSNSHRSLFNQYVVRRSQGEPLQYILQSEFFGDLEMKCRHGVLIPRQETAASVSYLVDLLRASKDQPETRAQKKLHVLDLCTGTGCISLLFHHEFYRDETMNSFALELVGVDISPRALSLARENLVHQIAIQAGLTVRHSARAKALHRIGFVQADVLSDGPETDGDHSTALSQALRRLKSDGDPPEYDVLIANPPYISPKAFKRTTSRSVRRYEPKLALVPRRKPGESDETTADSFFVRLLQIAEQVNAKTALLEVADMDQAMRVAQAACEQGPWTLLQIWRDEPTVSPAVREYVTLHGRVVEVIGTGHGRSVLVSRLGPCLNDQETAEQINRVMSDLVHIHQAI